MNPIPLQFESRLDQVECSLEDGDYGISDTPNAFAFPFQVDVNGKWGANSTNENLTDSI